MTQREIEMAFRCTRRADILEGNGANGEPVDADGQPASVNSRTTHRIGFDDPQINPSFPLGQLNPVR